MSYAERPATGNLTKAGADDTRGKQIVATGPYVKLKVRALYSRASGTARFDGLSAVLQ